MPSGTSLTLRYLRCTNRSIFLGEPPKRSPTRSPLGNHSNPPPPGT